MLLLPQPLAAYKKHVWLLRRVRAELPQLDSPALLA